MVTSPHYLATQAGIDILRRGGNALDAAVAVSAVLSVVYPHMCGIGGDAFMLFYHAETGRLMGMNASGRSAAAADIAAFSALGMKAVPDRGPLAAITVPGAVSGWELARQFSAERMGSPLSWSEILEPAVSYAQEGFPVSPSLAMWMRLDSADKGVLRRYAEAGRIYLNNGRPYAPGEMLRQPELAATLRRVALQGARECYEGETAERMCACLKELGGLLAPADFSAQHAFWTEPLSVNYRGLQACNLPPNTQGMASLEILNILKRFDMAGMKEGSADYVHVITEATKEAFSDRDSWLTDPDFADIPLAALLSDEHAARQSARMRMDAAAHDLHPLTAGGDTVWLGAADRHGNAVSYIQSLYFDFGSGVIPDGTGVLLQNRGCFFSLDPQHINALMPCKRTAHTLNPAMLLKNGRPFLVYGTMGGEGQPQTQAALVTRIVDFSMPPQQAIDAPRWLYGRSWGDSGNSLLLEGRFDDRIAGELAARGHQVRRAKAFTDAVGHAGAILINAETGVMQGGSDPRSDGLAAGW
ncbi:MAG: gamma-glutamyltransferase [Mailhella sp.]|nr:gamma-glutamyltransferase [Mailhella sp.]